jgi:hypothetical protein
MSSLCLECIPNERQMQTRYQPSGIRRLAAAAQKRLRAVFDLC